MRYIVVLALALFHSQGQTQTPPHATFGPGFVMLARFAALFGECSARAEVDRRRLAQALVTAKERNAPRDLSKVIEYLELASTLKLRFEPSKRNSAVCDTLPELISGKHFYNELRTQAVLFWIEHQVISCARQGREDAEGINKELLKFSNRLKLTLTQERIDEMTSAEHKIRFADQSCSRFLEQLDHLERGKEFTEEGFSEVLKAEWGTPTAP